MDNLTGRRMGRRPFITVTFVFCTMLVLPTLIGDGTFAYGIALYLQLPAFLVYAALSVYRLHDIGRSGWYALLLLVPLVNLLLMLYLVTKEGNGR